ncbi:uncharacterized protein LOC124893527 [Capsicum annuum]|uniref:uncharacterized protein LOC124893527 n=1 Tax=Capsicum annuum TaxID=4072 RepID=UPI001FB1570A|nr:uncharacterized protein LOC124893527 [Capsicum annuum]
MNEEIVRIKESHGARDHDGLGYNDLCVNPGVDLLEGYKVPKFEVFDGAGSPMAHLRRYYEQLVGIRKNEALLMCLFSKSLSGEDLEWFMSQQPKRWTGWKALAKGILDRFSFNIEIVPNRYSLDRIKQKSDEIFQDYAFHWRKEAAKVQPPISEEDMVSSFSRTQEGEYYTRMVSAVRATFADLVKIGESLEEGIRTGKIAETLTLSGTAMLLKKKNKDVGTISAGSVAKTIKKFNSRNVFSSLSSPNLQHVFYAHPQYQTSLSNVQHQYQTPLPNIESQ